MSTAATARVTVLTFAGAREVLGLDRLELEVPVALSARELLDAICRLYPALVPYAPSLRVAINGVYAAPGDLVSEGDEVAIIPPVAGG